MALQLLDHLLFWLTEILICRVREIFLENMRTGVYVFHRSIETINLSYTLLANRFNVC